MTLPADPTRLAAFRIIAGDSLAVLPTLPAASVQTVVTSPPYWGLRDYGIDGQLGREATPGEYVAALVAIFAEVRRVLRDDGTVWLNLGDTFTAKNLTGIPWMVAFALRDDGWYLRSEIVWAKPNPMPESVTDRPTRSHEQLFLLTKSPCYFYDHVAIREPETSPEQTAHNQRYARAYDNEARIEGGQPGNVNNRGIHARPGLPGRNKRDVWTVTPTPFPDAHFATYPPALIEPCILAGTPPKCCGVCGAPWRRLTERTAMVVRPTPKREAWQASDDHARTQTGGTMVEPPRIETIGWEPTCEHDDDTGRAMVLDPFCGAGTTGVVALRHGRDFTGIEMNPDYAVMARERIADDAPLLNAEVA